MAPTAPEISEIIAWIKECSKYDPPKSEVSDAKLGFGVQKILKGAPKNEKNKKGPSYILPKIIYGISEPYGDLLHWNLS